MIFGKKNSVTGSSRPLTIGFALDVSGSMETSLQNTGGGSLSRLEGLRSALDAVLDEAWLLSGAVAESELREANLRFFAYAYGLKNLQGIEVADLFRLVEVSNGLSESPELTDARQRMVSDFERRLRTDERRVAMEVMGSDAYSLLSMSRAEAEAVLRARIEANIRSEILRRSIQTIRSGLGRDSTLTLAELRERWAVLRTGLSGSSDFLGGSTPMAACMRAVEARFERERRQAPPGSRFILLVVSDGESTDGTPLGMAGKIRKQGIEVISCFVSSSDLGGGKLLYGRHDRRWPRGARVMCKLASSVSAGSPECRYLREAGWRFGQTRTSLLEVLAFKWLLRLIAGKRVKMFAQVNHSAVLEEFLRVVIAPLRAEHRS